MKKISILIILCVISSCQEKPCNTLVYQNGSTFFNGERYSGQCSDFHTNGEISSIKTYENGFDHGLWEFFFSNGNLKLKGQFHYGKRIGEWNYYFESGEIWKKHYYSDGEKSGTWLTFNIEGEIIKKEKVIK